MYEVNLKYINNFKYEVRSQNYSINVELPKENQALEGITPPALLLASVGSCLAVYLERYLKDTKIGFDKFFINVKSDICKESPHYLKTIDIKIEIPGLDLDEKRKRSLLEFIKNCPVHNTLANRPQVNIEI